MMFRQLGALLAALAASNTAGDNGRSLAVGATPPTYQPSRWKTPKRKSPVTRDDHERLAAAEAKRQRKAQQRQRSR